MKQSKWIVFLLSAVVMAQNAETRRPADEEAEWAKIRALKSIYEDAVSSNQIEKLRPYIADNFHGVLVTGAEARSFDDLVKRNQEIRDLIGPGGSYHVKLTYEPGTMFGNLAVANGMADETVVTSSGKRFEYVSRWLVNLIKENGTWKLYRFQSTLNPVNNVFVQDTVKYTRLFFGGGGLVIGVLIGFLLRGLRR
ncbi:MAG TPA: hypothetical protein VHU83_22665 [Bryobacteraceae bacterium]|jgi:hypothetical protein|nr:hypothetical protein [Bryobacteraceae bacterium]